MFDYIKRDLYESVKRDSRLGVLLLWFYFALTKHGNKNSTERRMGQPIFFLQS